MGIAYGLIVLVAAGVLAVRYAGLDRPSPRSKWALGGVVLASAVVHMNIPDGQLPAFAVLLGVCVYVILYQIVDTELSRPDSWAGTGSVRGAADHPPRTAVAERRAGATEGRRDRPAEADRHR